MPWRIEIDGELTDVVWTDEEPDGVMVFRSFGLAREAARQQLTRQIAELRRGVGYLAHLRAKDRPPESGGDARESRPLLAPLARS